MATLLEGLFGLRPNLESQQENMQVDRGMGFGELLGRAGVNPYAPKAVQDAYLGRQAAQGALVGKAMNTAAGLFGIETPELQRAKGMESILQQTQADTDLNNPAEFYPTLAKRMAEGGYTQEAVQIGQVGAKAIQDFNLNTSTVNKNLQEARAQQRSSILDIAKFQETQLTALDKEYRSKDNVKKQIAQGLILPEDGKTKLADIDANINKMTTGALANVNQRIVSLTDLKADGVITEKQQQQLDGLIQMEKTLKEASGTKLRVSMGDKIDTGIRDQLDIPLVKAYSENADAARKIATDSVTIAALLAKSEGGMIAKISTELANDLGIQSENVSAQNLANALATRGAVGIRAVGSGSTSDLEFKAYIRAFPSLANSAGGRKLMASYAVKLAERQEKLADYGRTLLRNKNFSQTEMSRYDNELGPVLGKDPFKVLGAGAAATLTTPEGNAAFNKYRPKEGE